jgi:2-polyprenyl-3-methyl-5-hydroxy-6-metoxy-1,4-benzoquinol methylase
MPDELALLIDRNGGMAIEQAAGMLYNPLAGTWSLSTDMAVNYIAVFRSRASKEESGAER